MASDTGTPGSPGAPGSPAPTLTRLEWLRSASVFLIAPGLLSLAEIVLRLVGYRYARTEVPFRFAGPELDMPELVRDPRLIWRIRPGSREIAVAGSDTALPHNTNGFRGAGVAKEKPAGVVRLAALGDSCTYGVGVSLTESYLSQAAARLQRAINQPVDTINAGVPGFSSFQGLRLLELEIVPLRPDVVTIYFGNWNDFVPAIGGDDEEKARRLDALSWSATTRRRISELRLAMAAMQAVDAVGAHPDPTFGRRTLGEYTEAFQKGAPLEGRRVPPEKFRKNLHAMVRICRANGIVPVFISPPLPDETQERFPVCQSYAAIVTSVAAAEQVLLVPVAAEMARREQAGEQLYLDWVHPNAAGHAIIATMLVRDLVKSRSIRVGP